MPERIVWRGESKPVTCVLASWQDWGFPAGVSKTSWRQRRHRTCFLVECDDGKLYEIYLDRGSVDKAEWFLYRVSDRNEGRG